MPSAVKVEEMRIVHGWSSPRFRPKNCTNGYRRLPNVQINMTDGYTETRNIPFPGIGEVGYVGFTGFPKEALGLGEKEHDRTRYGWPALTENGYTWTRGFYWFDIGGTVMGKIQLTSLGRLDQIDVRTKHELQPAAIKLLVKLLKAAQNPPRPWIVGEYEGETDSEAGALNAFANLSPAPGECGTRAYLVDWALAERRTGLSFPSMDAFEKWAAQQGLTVIAVADAPGGGGDESESEGESEGEA